MILSIDTDTEEHLFHFRLSKITCVIFLNVALTEITFHSDIRLLLEPDKTYPLASAAIIQISMIRMINMMMASVKLVPAELNKGV